jgi:D-alanyl-D-alanine carboxypeptidase
MTAPKPNAYRPITRLLRLSRLRLLSLGSPLLLLAACGDMDPVDETYPEDLGQIHAAEQSVLLAPQPVYAGLFEPGTWGSYATVQRSKTSFEDRFAYYEGQGYRLHGLTAHVLGSDVRFSGVFRKGAAEQVLKLDLSLASFDQELQSRWSNGYTLTALATHVKNGEARFSGVFTKGGGGQYVWLNRTKADFEAKDDSIRALGYRLSAISSYFVGGEVRYNGIWSQGTQSQKRRLGRTLSGLQAVDTDLSGQGYHMVALSAYVNNRQEYYDSLWEVGSTNEFELSLDKNAFLDETDERFDDDMRLRNVVGSHVERLNVTEMAQLIADSLEPNSVGYAATIVHDGFSVGTSGGLRRTAANSPQADASSTARTNVASVSKLMTAIGVMRWVEEKGISLDTKIGPYLPTGWDPGENIENVTLRQLLKHTSGLDSADSSEDYSSHQYAGIKRVVQTDLALTDQAACEPDEPNQKAKCYENVNYSLFRIVMPYLTKYAGFTEHSSLTENEKRTAASFHAYMNDRVFLPAGLSSVAVKPASTNPTLSYPFPAGTTRGTHWGDWSLTFGASGYQLSSDDIATLLEKLNDGTLVPTATADEMKQNLLGYRFVVPLRFGNMYYTGGILHDGRTPESTRLEVNTKAFSFDTRIHVGVVVNSNMDTDVTLTDAVQDAYEAAWHVTDN